MTTIEANQLSEKARELSRLCRLWLDHPFNAHAAHELAASAQEQVNNQSLAAEHRKAAAYWAKKELEWNDKIYTNRVITKHDR